MRKLMIILGMWGILMFSYGCDNDKPGIVESKLKVFDPVPLNKTNDQKVFVHYMTWYETKASSGNNSWGSHWTMASKNPDVMDASGKREIASHFYPLIGPYASGDKDVIEYHLLLMKYAGIDGVMIDWYGVHDVYDYPQIKKNTEEVVKLLGKVGLEFSIVYEDRTVSAVVDQGKASSRLAAAQQDMRYLQSDFFSKANYTKINSKPLLLVFGPINFQTESDWTSVFSVLNPKPCFLTLWNESSEAGINAKGEYAWVYMNNTYLDNFYSSRIQNLEVAIGSAYPGFIDYYSQGGWQDDIHWVIDHNNGTTLDETLQKSLDAGVDYLQLVTWNDFGEGTIIEPTLEFEYDYLDKIKTHAGVSGNNLAFSHIYKLYQLRKQFKSNETVQKKLDQVFYYFVSLQLDKIGRAHV